MDHTTPMRALRAFALLLLTTAFASTAVTQTGCADFGCTPVLATVTDSPLPLGCSEAPLAAQWRLFTPGHRAPAPHAGFRPGNAHALPRILVRYRCTGLLLLPVVPAGVRLSGYVLDQPEYACIRS